MFAEYAADGALGESALPKCCSRPGSFSELLRNFAFCFLRFAFHDPTLAPVFRLKPRTRQPCHQQPSAAIPSHQESSLFPKKDFDDLRIPPPHPCPSDQFCYLPLAIGYRVTAEI